jgi:predicted phage terminase large subunit-like protein
MARKASDPSAARTPALAEIDHELETMLATLAGGGERLADFILRLSPHRPPPRHVEPLIAVIERARQERVRVCVSMPPRHAKSLTVLHGIAWWLKSAPADTLAYFSYADDLARSKSRIARRLALDAGVRLASDSANLSEWRTIEGGGLLAGGAGGGLTGHGVSGLLVVDDPLKNREEADSPVIRNRVWEWLNEVGYTRMEGASAICIGTRWHQDDLIGRLEATGEWQMLSFPAIAEEADQLGRAPGDALWPERFPVEELETIRRQIGEWSFASLYQGLPRPRGTSVFGEPHYFDLSSWTPAGARVVIGADPAASEKTSADWSVALVLAIEGRGDRVIGRVLDLWRGQVTIPVFTEQLRRLSRRWWNAAIAVEAVGGFRAVPQLLRAVDPLLRLTEVKLHGDKFQRAQAVAAAWNDGRVLVPTSAPWLASLLAEVGSFTGVRDAHDDQVDALAHAWNSLQAGTVRVAHLNRGPFAVRRSLAPTDGWGRSISVVAA